MQGNNYHIAQQRMEEERDLVAQAIEDPRHFEKLYGRYFLPIFKYIFNRIRMEHETAEITSDVFAKALVNIKKYKYKEVPFVSWLYGIARNEMLQHFRKQKIQNTVFVEEDKLRHFTEEIDSVNKEELFEKMKKALEELAPEELELVEMKFFQQLSHKEIAAILNISEENARVKTFRVIKKLKETVNKMGEL
ncbi:MAG: sigma-70 family RNA polymerase sigma factor [Bacteroidetes bacterium]|nr:sigma-70 family RNA polymerase sigma factor [Bacteroidota bacterium]